MRPMRLMAIGSSPFTKIQVQIMVHSLYTSLGLRSLSQAPPAVGAKGVSGGN